MTASATIRNAGPEDADRTDAALRALSDTLGDTHRADAATLKRALSGSHPACRAVLAETDAVVGVAVYAPLLSTVRGGIVVHVSDLWVADAYRGTGLGKRLLAAVLADADTIWDVRGLRLGVYATSSGARAFYDGLGFAPFPGVTDLHLGPEDCDRLRRMR